MHFSGSVLKINSDSLCKCTECMDRESMDMIEKEKVQRKATRMGRFIKSLS